MLNLIWVQYALFGGNYAKYEHTIKIYKQIKSSHTTQQKRQLTYCFISSFLSSLWLKYSKQKAFLAEALSKQLQFTDTDTYMFHNSVL